uniref:EphrinB ephrin n=1 Tax=Phallusia mammillata TaxID=59560 RepID=A0A6F9DC89_9ASCI|nr:EphrinB ephrin precursor [Phallusia mammillata]
MRCMMFRLRMEELTIFAIVLSIMIWVMECSVVEGRTLDPIYWNTSKSNPTFKAGSQSSIDVALLDKLDIICPRRGRDTGDHFFKLFLVSKENFGTCNATGGRRLITCDVPQQEKKYTFYFQEISPSPWGLEFEPNKAYYVISTSDGTKDGIDNKKGGVCQDHNMKIELRVHKTSDDQYVPRPAPAVVDPPTSDVTVVRPPTHEVVNVEEQKHEKSTTIEVVVPTNSGSDEPVASNGLVIGIVLGACAVLFVVLIAFLGYKVYRRRRHMKKYQSPPITPTRGSTPLQQVTLLPIASSSHHHHHAHGRLHSDSDRHRTATLNSHSDLRPPPSYNESFLDNGGPVVAV